MPKHLVLVGAGHAHLTVLKNIPSFISAGHRVTVIGPSRHHYYSGMGPGMLAGIYQPEEVRFNVRAMAVSRGANFIEDMVVRVDPARKELRLRTGGPLIYDVVSFNTGSGVAVDEGLMAHPAVVPVKPIEELLHVRSRIIAALKEKPLSLVVAGGGPAGLEIAANLRRLVSHESGAGEVLLVAGDGLLPGFGPSVRQKAMRSLTRIGVTLIEGQRVISAEAHSVQISSGESHPCDFLFMAVGVRPSSLFKDSNLSTSTDGGLRVNRYLQAVAHTNIFGGGDCITFDPRPLAKVGVYAVRQNRVLLRNLGSALSGGDLVAFSPQKDYLLAFNMGDGTAIVRWKSLMFDGRVGFVLKNYLDRKFMKMFQE